MAQHDITEFYTTWFSVCPNITSKPSILAIFKNFTKRSRLMIKQNLDVRMTVGNLGRATRRGLSWFSLVVPGDCWDSVFVRFTGHCSLTKSSAGKRRQKLVCWQSARHDDTRCYYIYAMSKRMHFVPCRFFSTMKMCEEASDVSWLTSSGQRLPLLHGVSAFKHNAVYFVDDISLLHVALYSPSAVAGHI
jgi:hypothetical protein